ncbi:alpha/beta hydrolase [Sulfitobacter sp. F26204]|uniref:alpha/beta hydrolase n=1 Tax=Sulfitobacter sp. F26204 TaxID=2996014 RepID=UPI00225E300A|nr:alpha/beta hydrolase [Sulfitobacter sp. F26204]MCX7560317.1 alpha/beta hydrolase [Sulfitobacter sp. F26204]
MSLRARLLNGWLRRIEKPAMMRAAGPEQLRKRLELQARLFFHAPRGTQMQWQVLAHEQARIEALEVVPANLDTNLVVLYLHGGGFVFGSPQAYSALAGQLAQRLRARVILPRYRLAPEHPYPAALEDCRIAWNGLIASGVAADQIVIGGDSAGGALALSLLGQLAQEAAQMPVATFCFSPLTDLSFASDSFHENAEKEAVLPAARAHEMAALYLDGQEETDPRVSPVFATFSGAAPVWLTVGNTEILRDDSRRMAEVLKRDGVDVTFVEEQDLPHVWPFFHNTLPEARKTLDVLTEWIRRKQVRQGES